MFLGKKRRFWQINSIFGNGPSVKKKLPQKKSEKVTVHKKENSEISSILDWQKAQMRDQIKANKNRQIVIFQQAFEIQNTWFWYLIKNTDEIVADQFSSSKC